MDNEWFLENAAAIFTPWVILVGSIIFFYRWIQSYLQQEVDRRNLSAALTQPTGKFIDRDLLSLWFNELDRRLGSSFNIHTLTWYLKFAYIYSFLFLFIAWLLGGSGQLDILTMFNDERRLL